MKRRLWQSIILALLACLVPMLTRAAQSELILERPIAPGVLYRELKREGPLRIYVTRVDLTNPAIQFEAVPGEDNLTDREQPSSVARRLSRPGYEVVAATNGDYGGAGNAPLGMFVREGRLLITPTTRSSLCIGPDNMAFIDVFDFQMTLRPIAGGTPVSIEYLNRWYDYAQPVLYGPLWEKSQEQAFDVVDVVLEVPDGALAPVDKRTVSVRRIVPGRGGTPIAAGEYVLQVPATSASASRFEVNARWVLESAMDPDPGAWDSVITGGPRIVRDGEAYIPNEEESIRQSFVTSLHPRTGFGISRDGKTFMMAVVDGRQPGHSVGVSLPTLADILIEQGAWDALNMDGGGSSTMVIRGEVKNSPSDATGERRTSSAFCVISTAPRGPLEHLRIDPAPQSLLASVPHRFEAKEYDEAWNPVSNIRVNWQAHGGEIDVLGPQECLVTFEPGLGGLAAAMGPLAESIQFQAVTAESWKVEPRAVLLSPGGSEEVKVRAFDVRDEELEVPEEAIVIEVEGGIADVQGATILATSTGSAEATVRAGPMSWTLPIEIRPKATITGVDFEENPGWILRRHHATEDGTDFVLDTAMPHTGSQAARLDYEFEPGVISAAYLDMEMPLEKGTTAISIWVHGNYSENMLRSILTDANGNRFILTLSNSISWVGWSRVEARLADMQPHWGNPTEAPVAPFTLTTIYVVEPRLMPGSETRTGTIYFDDMQIIGVN